MAAADVHRDFRDIAKQLEQKGCTLVRKGNHVEVRTANGTKVYSLPGRAQKSGNVHQAQRELTQMGLIEMNGRRPRRRVGHRPGPTPIEQELRRAAEAAGHRELTDDEVRKLKDSVPEDPDTPGRGPRNPRHLGVLRPYDHRRSPMPAMRYIGNAAWGDFVVRRLRKHLEEFDSKTDFVRFAIEVAKDREIPAPNSRRGAKAAAWDVVRIANILQHLLERKNAKSLTLQFFSAACDELEGVPSGNYVVTEGGQEVEKKALLDSEAVVGVRVFADDAEEDAPDAGEVEPEKAVEATGGAQESPDESTHMDHKERLANILLDKLESGEQVDEALVDRITKLLG